jgi:hypothetical protein
MAVFTRSVARVDHPEARQGMTPAHRVPPLPPAAMRGDRAALDPFLALMEDWFPRRVLIMNSEVEIIAACANCRADRFGPTDGAASGRS